MRAVKWTVSVGLVLAVCFLLLYSGPVVRSAEKENHCFTCHSNPGKLVAITREIAKTRKGKPAVSPETKGEG